MLLDFKRSFQNPPWLLDECKLWVFERLVIATVRSDCENWQFCTILDQLAIQDHNSYLNEVLQDKIINCRTQFGEIPRSSSSMVL
jgi:hypothetical protein